MTDPYAFLHQSMSLPICLGAALVVLVAYECWSKTIKFRVIAKIPGPPSDSWLYGCSTKFGEYIFEWQKKFGAIYKFKACVGDHRIMIADPRAIDYVHKNVYSFPRSAKFREFTRLFTSDGVSWAEGEDHRRQRSVLTPSFSPSHIRDLFPKFLDTAQTLVEKWQGIIKSSPDGNRSEIEITPWMQRATLDVIGIGIKGYYLDA
ncbi:hypothetical protein VKT23_017822 [Stygiomarasmius scandens]|uniref:Cytochrome P450 n=1 Tax=Marasmiellus scandens TaxID=2682957 RepID=A0ABR1IR09_9AGAR